MHTRYSLRPTHTCTGRYSSRGGLVKCRLPTDPMIIDYMYVLWWQYFDNGERALLPGGFSDSSLH